MSSNAAAPDSVTPAYQSATTSSGIVLDARTEARLSWASARVVSRVPVVVTVTAAEAGAAPAAAPARPTSSKARWV